MDFKRKSKVHLTIDGDNLDIVKKYCNENCISMSGLVEKLLIKELKSKGVKFK